METEDKITLFLNATALNYLACERRYQVSALWGYKDKASEAADFGNDFHTFAYHLEGPEKLGVIDQVQRPEIALPFKSNPDFAKLCVFYEACPILQDGKVFKDNEGKISLEYKFHIPWAQTDKYNIHLVGTIDRADTIRQCVRVIDRKTSRKIYPTDVLQGYNLQVQVPFYMYIWKKYLAKDFPEEIRNLPVIGQYLGVFMSFEPAKFELGNIISYTDSLEADIEEHLQSAARKMIELADRGEMLAPPTGMAAKLSDETVCKFCFLANLCRTRDHAAIIKYLKTLPSSVYDPRSWR